MKAHATITERKTWRLLFRPQIYGALYGVRLPICAAKGVP